MNGWMQRSDFSAEDIEVIDLEDALRKWNAINKADEDALMAALEQAGKETCPWGFAVTNEDGVQIHIYRVSPSENTFSARVSKNHASNELDPFPEAFVTGTLTAFFTNWRSLLSGVK